jgi:hypothetical protein
MRAGIHASPTGPRSHTMQPPDWHTTIGVLSNASRLRTRTRRPSMAVISTLCRPMGSGGEGSASPAPYVLPNAFREIGTPRSSSRYCPVVELGGSLGAFVKSEVVEPAR